MYQLNLYGSRINVDLASRHCLYHIHVPYTCPDHGRPTHQLGRITFEVKVALKNT